MRRKTFVLGFALFLSVACGGRVEGIDSSRGGKSSGGMAGKAGGGGISQTGGFGGSTGGVYPGGSGGAGGMTRGTGGGVGGWAGAPPAGMLGAACDSQGGCDYMVCVDPLMPGGGVAHGMCTFECKSDPSFCGKAVQGASCQAIGGSMYCVPPCKPGPESLTQFDPKKCFGRSELACAELSDGAVGCRPNCNGDFDCPNGTVCSPKTGLCQVGAVSGAAVGTACTSDDACKGQCLNSICAEPCTLGALPSCGWGGPGTGSAAAACLVPSLTNSTTGIGDLGYCVPLCNIDSDCSVGDCALFGDAEVTTFFGKNGYCSP